jgi:hypothetical protein
MGSRFGAGICASKRSANQVECAPSIGAHALPAKYNGVTVSRGSREQPRPSASRSARSWAMPRDRSASYSRCAATPSQNAAPIIRTAATADQADTAGGGGHQPVGCRCRWVASQPNVSSKLRNIFHAPNVKDRTRGPSWTTQIRPSTPGRKASILSPALEILMILGPGLSASEAALGHTRN